MNDEKITRGEKIAIAAIIISLLGTILGALIGVYNDEIHNITDQLMSDTPPLQVVAS